jgi:magnesium chelatase subunit I
VARLARTSPHVNQQSGVSVRMSIANLENVVSNAERRAIMHREPWIVPRPSDLAFAVPSSRGKLELTMTEEEGHDDKLIGRIIDESIKNIFAAHFDLRELRPVVDYFENGQSVELGKVPGLRKRAEELAAGWVTGSSSAELRTAAAASAAEFMLEGLHVHNKINKQAKAGGTSYRR